ncbi:MAG: nitroreductase [Firmicutes bacterium]|nr:nitroreductase [Bacillota bacterium]
MNPLDIIKTRKSVRTFDGQGLREEDWEKLRAFAGGIRNPYHIPVTFVWLDAAAHGLSSPVIAGEAIYVAGKVPKVEHCEEAFGYSFEQLVLFAWSLGIGSTWIGGTMDRELFEKAANTGKDEYMMIVSPLGYPALEPAEADRKLRKAVRGDERLAASELFFDKDFSTPLTGEAEWLEAVRWAPSAANRQPCRIVKDGNAYHFYEKHTLGNGARGAWDVQKIDIGIAICHFMSVAGGALTIAEPGIDHREDIEYIATVSV